MRENPMEIKYPLKIDANKATKLPYYKKIFQKVKCKRRQIPPKYVVDYRCLQLSVEGGP